MNDAPRVSIALATYNGEQFIEEQLRSIAVQTLRPFELIVSDDGSNDATLLIIDEFAKRVGFPVIIISDGSHLGYRQNFRRAVNRCSGELIAFCDQDDVWHPMKLETLSAAFIDKTIQLAYHNATLFGGSEERLLYLEPVETRLLKSLDCSPFKLSVGMTQMFRASLKKYDHYWDYSADENESGTILAHDQWFFFLALIQRGVLYIDKSLIRYRQHARNTARPGKWLGPVDRVRMKLLHFGDQDSRSAHSARGRAEIASLMSLEAGSADLGAVAEFYDHLALRLSRRSQVYLAGSMTSRGRWLLKSIIAGDYARVESFFRPSSIVRDVVSGVLLGRTKDPTRDGAISQ